MSFISIPDGYEVIGEQNDVAASGGPEIDLAPPVDADACIITAFEPGGGAEGVVLIRWDAAPIPNGGPAGGHVGHALHIPASGIGPGTIASSQPLLLSGASMENCKLHSDNNADYDVFISFLRLA